MILRPKENCWKIISVKKLALLYDADEYYRAFFDVVRKAKRSVKVAGWELDSRFSLAHLGKPLPDDLRSFFNALVMFKKNLKVHLLCWKAPFYIRFGRERFIGLRWLLGAPLIHFRSEASPFIYGSFHEKLALIDDRLAFVGGMDLGKKRWDTPDHRLQNPLRKDRQGKIYHPNHDLQFVLSGEVTQHLKELFHKRSGLPLTDEEGESEIWPHDFAPELTDTRVGLSRTDPLQNIFEIEKLYEDAIVLAKKFIYIENQYFSHERIIDLLALRLREAQGPEVIVVLPLFYRGWFERATYIKARNKAMKKLRASDLHGRLLILYPHVPQDNFFHFLIVHTKLLVTDGNLYSLGSPNLNHRSMRVDSELNLALEGDPGSQEEAYIQFQLCKLMGEHLEMPVESVQSEWEDTGSVKKTIENLMGKKQKTLEPIPHIELALWLKLMGLISSFIDMKFLVNRRRLATYTCLFCMIILSVSWIFHEAF
jgi:phospholipase D1/2